MNSGATFDAFRVYRYRLWREWDPTLPRLLVIGLNPSTADETKPDPTITRCIGFAKAWGHGALDMGNLFALKSTDPRVLKCKNGPRPEGDPENLDHLLDMAARASRVLCAWGNHGKINVRSSKVLFALDQRGLTDKLVCFGFTKQGAPEHPLYQRADRQPIRMVSR